MGQADRNNPTAQWMRAHTGAATRGELYDQFGRQVQIGDMVCVGNHPGEIFRVASTKPVMRPDVPAGLVEVQLVQVVVQMMDGGVPIGGLVKVRDASEYLTEEQLAAFKAEMKGDVPKDLGQDPKPPASSLVIP